MNKSIAVLLAAGFFSATAALAGQDRLIPLTANGPGQGGVVRGILHFAADTNLKYVAILGAGIYKSTDAGATWTPSSNGLGHLEVRQIRSKPGSTTQLYTATEGGGGFYKSTDGGANWSASNTGLTNRFVRFVIVATSSGHIFLATTSGAFRSTNEGATWSPICPGMNSFVNFVTTDPTGQFLRLSVNGGLYFSGDFGASCSLASNGMTGPGGSAPNVHFATFVAATGTWVAPVAGNGVFYSTNGGFNWNAGVGIPAGAPPLGSFGFPSSSSSATMWVPLDGVGIYKSTNGGVNWALDTTLSGLPRQVSFFVTGPDGTVWAATFAGVYKSVNGGANWTKVSNGLPNGHVVNLAGVDLLNVYAPGETVYKSTDGGVNWVVSDSGLDGRLTHRTQGLIPVSATTLYVSTLNYGIYKSIDAGASWFAVNNGLPTNLAGAAPAVRVAPSNSEIVYAFFGNGSGVFRSDNGGANWTDIGAGLFGPARSTRGPAIHPTNPDIVYVATSGGVYKTTDGGASWALKSPAFGSFSISRVEISRNDPETLVAVSWTGDGLDRAATSSGLYLSRNGGETWRQLASNEKIPHARIVESPGGSTDLYVISRGHFEEFAYGIFKCVGLTDQDFSVDTHCSEVPRGEEQGIPWSLTVLSGRFRAVATTTGIYRQRFHFLGPDFNNDGKADILWRNASSGENWAWLMNGSGFFGENAQGFGGVGQLRSVGSPWFVAGLGDFDGNGKSDILWRNSSTGENYIYLMDGFTIVGEGYIRTVPDQNWQVAGIGDFGSSEPGDDLDNDGRSDILWRHAISGENYVYMMNGLQIASTEGFIRTVADPNWQVAAVGDLDGDTIADILWRNATTGENYLYPMQGKTVKPGEGYLRTVPGPWAIAGLGDFNQDDRMDVVWRNGATGENYVYPMNGTTILPTEGYLPTVPDTDWAIVGLGDYDGQGDQNSVKGMSDILWRHASGSNYLWRMGGPTTVTTLCGNLGCTNGYLPTINAAGFGVVQK